MEVQAARARPPGSDKCVFALLVILAIVVIVATATSLCRLFRKEKLSFPLHQDTLGYRIPLPGDPGKNILRRSVPYPPHRYPVGGLADFYFRYDPAYSTGFENDYCQHNPVACGGFVLEPFCPTA
jgi:hypothetical protein